MSDKTVVFGLFEGGYLAKSICEKLKYTLGEIEFHQYPDQETAVFIKTFIENKTVIFVTSTNNPNEKIAKLFFSSETARELGAKKIGLITPYLAYMRQDKQFSPGEGITSKYFAKMISTYFDWCLTIDPHLHRWKSLSDVFSVPTILLHATQDVAAWIKKNITKPILIGPDLESEQWVAEIAKAADSPYLIVEKQRFSDISVKSTIPKIDAYQDYTPVLVDDIISTAMTMIETVDHLKTLGMKKIYCIGVHAVFSKNAYENLLATQVSDIITCNTIIHPTNKIDLSKSISDALKNSRLI